MPGSCKFLPAALTYLAVACGVLLFSISDAGAKAEAEEKYDLVLDGVPFKMKPIRPGSAAEAVEETPDGLRSLRIIVYFKIQKIHAGSLPKLRVEPPSRLSQVQDALKDKDWGTAFFGLQRQASEFDRKWFRVGVKDPFESFGFSKWADPIPAWTYRLYLRRHEKEEDTYILGKSEKIQVVEPAAEAGE